MADNSSSNLLLLDCFKSTVSLHITNAFFPVRSIVSFPLCAIVLHLGHHRWRRQRSFKAASHSDVITYHVAAMDLFWVPVCLSYFLGLYTDVAVMEDIAFFTASLIFYGEIFFHILTCVDRYLAVVHPVTYLGLKGERGSRIRNLSIGCAWLLSFASIGVTVLHLPNFPIVPLFCTVGFSVTVLSFCSISSLLVLIRPGPGEGGRQKEHVDQSKQRAFLAIVAILGVQWLWFAGLLVFLGLFSTSLLSQSDACVAMMCSNWCNLPSSLVLPLLFLHRAGKLPCC